jgi:signal transduction histidine kinase
MRPRTRKKGRIRRSNKLKTTRPSSLKRQQALLRESLQQQAATADIFKAISRSSFDLETVLNSLCESATRLCGADHAWLFQRQGETFRWVASFGHATEVHERIKNYFKPLQVFADRGSVTGRVALDGKVVHIPDVLADPQYTWAGAQAIGGYRAALGVPLLRDDGVVGVIFVAKTVPKPFTEKQIDLVTTFADQAVIAIESVRRTDELSESLQQQTAIADIFKAISRSSFDLETVLNSLCESATRLCGADMAWLFQRQDDSFRWAASFGNTIEVHERIRSYFKPLQVFADEGSVTGRVALHGKIVHIPDVLADPQYTWAGAQKIGGYRTALGVPLLRDSRVVGVIFVAKTKARAFTEKQIELVTTFADQAVIAIESVRLLNALRERTDELSEKSRQLEMANTYKARFLAAASHDLRQPLHALNLFIAQLHNDHPDAGERTRLVSQIDAAMSAMNELFDSLLDMSKLDAGILTPKITELPVDRLLKRLQTTFAQAAREKGIRLKIVPSRAWIRSDPILLGRILLNLLSNAVRYTANGGVVVGCRNDGGMLRIDVCDTGEGIPEDKQKEIFAEFYQLDTSDRDRLGGLGLGLSIVDRLAQLLGHTIKLTSKPGKGSRFSVLVSVAAERPEIDEFRTSPAVADRAKDKLIIVMDDDALVRDGMRGILSGWGCRVVAAASDKEALAQLSNGVARPDLIISDYRLADGHSGISAIAHLRSKLGEMIPAFLVSGDTGPERLREVNASGHQLLHKPLSPMALRTVINRLLKASDSSS